MKGDFHIHSTISDGELTPKEIVSLAKEKGLDVIAITDHNSVNGVLEGIEEGKKLGIKVVPALELSTRYKGKRVHMLGYFNWDIYNDIRFINALKLVKKGRINEFKKLIFKEEDSSSNKKLSVKDGIRFLKIFKGIVILAHPVAIDKDILNEVLEYEFNGIEAIHSRNSEKDTEYFVKLAKENGYIYTAGSDFHKKNDTSKKHGTIGGVYLELNDIDKLFGFWKN